jgi:phosphate transport system substrate-binding protein
LIRGIAAALSATVILAGAARTPAVHAATPRAHIDLTGAGSTFDFPLFDKIFRIYGQSHDVTVNYQGIGSGAGIQQFTARTVDFGASDVPMNPATELPAAIRAGGPVYQIPVALGGVSVAYNIPGVKSSKLHLTGAVLARIFLGSITTWNNKAITSVNKGVKLPSLHITPVYRNDSSGTSYIFTDYLSKVSDQWRQAVGVGKLPNWPAGVGGKGSPGVAAVVQQTPGAIGYVEQSYILQNKMAQAAIQNRAKQYVTPSTKSVSAAAAQFPHVSAQRFSITNAPGKTSYPIAGYSWALLFKKQSSAEKASALSALFRWTASTAQKYGTILGYTPLPRKIQQSVVKSLKLTA